MKRVIGVLLITTMCILAIGGIFTSATVNTAGMWHNASDIILEYERINVSLQWAVDNILTYIEPIISTPEWTSKTSSILGYKLAVSNNGEYQTIFAATSIFTSSDYGNTWIFEKETGAMRDVEISDDGKYQTAIESGGAQISSNYGKTWRLEAIGGLSSITVSSSGQYQTMAAGRP